MVYIPDSKYDEQANDLYGSTNIDKIVESEVYAKKEKEWSDDMEEWLRELEEMERAEKENGYCLDDGMDLEFM